MPMRRFMVSVACCALALCCGFAAAQAGLSAKAPARAASSSQPIALNPVRTVVSPPVGPSAWSDQPVELILTPQWSAQRGFTALKFNLIFDTPLVTELVLRLPDAWGGERALHTHWRNLQAEGATLSPMAEAHRYTLNFERGARVNLSWEVVNGADFAAANSRNDYRPLVSRTHFHVLGNAAIPRVEGMWSSSPARFSVKQMPHGKTFASDLEHGGMGRSMTVADLVESVMVGGDFRVLEAGQGARMAIRGQWKRSDAEWKSQFSRIARAHRDYWGSPPEPFLVTVLDLPSQGANSASVGGTGRSDAFAFFATTNAREQTLDQVMAHEMMHTWVPRRLGGMPQYGEALNYWLSEGFTDFVAWRSLVRGRLWTPEQFVSVFNAQLKDHDLMPERKARNEEIGAGFWTSSALQRLPYMRGMLFGHWLDAQVRRATQDAANLDDVLLRMQSMAVENQSRVSRDQRPATAAQNLRVALRDIAGLDAAQGIENHIENGLPVELPVGLFSPCGELTTINRAGFDRGFDAQATAQNNNVVTGTRAGSPAHDAGLRDGMRILRRTGGEIGDATVPLAYEVQDGPQVLQLSWLPMGLAAEQYREFRLKRGLGEAERTACIKRLGG